MAKYSCYFLNAEDHILSMAEFDAETLGEAFEIARDKRRRTTFAVTIELWQGDRKLYQSPPPQRPRD